MPTYIALFRGMNVSGKNIIKMQDLKNLMDKLGFEKVQSYIQSGNLVFEFEEKNREKIGNQIQNAIQSEFGLKIEILILFPEEISAAWEFHPFMKEENLDVKQHYFVFLNEEPDSQKLKEFLSLDWPGEKVMYAPKLLFVYYGMGAGNSKLSTNLIENKLKVVATMRNLNTVKKLMEMLKD
jgi:uncharacterized protein (DUF1697 family)